MGRRGPRRRLELEAAYWELIDAGVGTVMACEQLGIGRKTGYRWRAENGGLPPEVLPDNRRTERYLSRLERHRIATLRRDGLSVRAIARLLDRSPSTVSRELHRNTESWDRGYDGDLAHSRARQRAGRTRPSRLAADPVLRALVQSKLELEWSPEQIAASLRAEHPTRPHWHLCHETIYRALYSRTKNGLDRTLTRQLRTQRPLRKNRRPATARTPRFVATGQLIDARPVEVEDRGRLGDWEGDLIIGTASRSAILTLVERRTRLLKLVHLPAGPLGHSADAVARALKGVLATLPGQARLTLTWDQGSEMAEHQRIAEHFAQGIYFAHAASPWQRGSNENTNGLVRQYFPKNIDLSIYTPARLADVERRINERPRKTLDWKTPAALFAGELATINSLEPLPAI